MSVVPVKLIVSGGCVSHRWREKMMMTRQWAAKLRDRRYLSLRTISTSSPRFTNRYNRSISSSLFHSTLINDLLQRYSPQPCLLALSTFQHFVFIYCVLFSFLQTGRSIHLKTLLSVSLFYPLATRPPMRPDSFKILALYKSITYLLTYTVRILNRYIYTESKKTNDIFRL